MKKYTILLLFFTCLFGQTQVLPSLGNLSNEDLDILREELQSQSDVSSDTSDDEPIMESVQISSDDSKETEEENYFGYSFFLNRDINFFDNIPSPPDFKLGPGDQIVLSLWGETNLRENFVINKEGLIYYENVGFINLSNKTIDEAEFTLEEELSKIYSTLKDKNKPTKLKLELGKLRSLNIYFSGEVINPGINLIHPFSDIFSAIVQSGGVKNSGSLRNVQLIRNNQVIAETDFYSFFTDGKSNFSNVRILDGDVIHVPVVTNRVNIAGSVITDGFYEIKDEERITHLIRYAGGLEATASSIFILDSITPLSDRIGDDNAQSSKFITINYNNALHNGDKITINPIGDVDTKVEIFGRIKLPGLYPALNANLKDVLLAAGGFEDPLYRKSIRDDQILVLRKDVDQFYGLEFKIPFKESEKFNLLPGDKIFVYENVNYNNLFSIEVNGAVNKRGRYQLKKGMTVNDAINLAEGFTELANQEAITVTETFTSTNDIGDEIEETTQVNDATLNFELTNGSVVNVLPLENVVSVQGNVYNPGLITYNRAKTVNKYINLAGGPKPNTLSTKIYVKRANGRIKKVTLLQGIGTIVRAGDTIFVPVDPDPSEFNVAAFTADILAVLTNLAAILVIVDNNND